MKNNIKNFTKLIVALMALFITTSTFAQCPGMPSGGGGSQVNTIINGGNGATAINVTYNSSFNDPGPDTIVSYDVYFMLDGEDPDVDTPAYSENVLGNPGIVDVTATGLSGNTAYDIHMRINCAANGPFVLKESFTTFGETAFSDYMVSVDPVTPTDSPTISVTVNGNFLGANNDLPGFNPFSNEEIAYCIGAGCDPFVDGTIVPQSGVNETLAVTYSTAVPTQVDGAVVRWAARYTRDATTILSLPAEVRTSDVQEYTVQAAGDNCNIIDAASIGATDITQTTATITFTPAATGADGSVPNTAQILIFRPGSTDYNESGVDVSQTSTGTVAVTGLLPGTLYSVRFLSQTCTGTTTIPDGSTSITDSVDLFTTLPSCSTPGGLFPGVPTATTMNFSFGTGATAAATYEWIAVAQGDPSTGAVLVSGSFPYMNSGNFTATGLSSSTDYTLYIRGICADGSTTPYSSTGVDFSTTACVAPADPVPSLDAATQTAADISWPAVTDATSYDWKVVADGAGAAAAAVAGNESTAQTGASASASGLTAGTAYDFYVRANTDCGGGSTLSSAWILLDFTTLASCDAPTGTPTILNITDTTVDVIFTFGGINDPATWEWIAVAQGDPATGTILASGSQPVAGSSSVAVSGLMASTDYSVYVRGICGDASMTDYTTNPANFTTLADPVQIVVTSSGNGTLTQGELTDAGVTQTGLTPAEIAAIQTAVVAATPAPTNTAELQAIVDAALEELAVSTVVTSSGGGTLTEMELTDAGVVIANSPLTPAQLDEIETAINAAMPVPTTTAEIQAIVTATEDNTADVATVVTSSGGGTLTEMELTDAGVVITNSPLTPAQLDEIETAINAAMPVPTTGAELQAIVDAVEESSAVAAVVTSANAGTLTEQELTDAGVTQTGLTANQIAAIQAAIVAAMPAPTDTAALQVIVDAAIAEEAAVNVVIASAGNNTLSQQELTDAGVTQTGLSPQEIEAIEIAINDASPAPNTTAELQALVDASINILGINDLDTATFRMYPNPTSGLVQIAADLRTISVFSMTGQIVLETLDNSFDTSGLDIGVYFVMIETNKGNIVKRLVKN